MLTGIIRCKLHYKTKDGFEIKKRFFIDFYDVDMIIDTTECTNIWMKTSKRPIKVYSPELSMQLMCAHEKLRGEKFGYCEIILDDDCYVEWEEE